MLTYFFNYCSVFSCKTIGILYLTPVIAYCSMLQWSGVDIKTAQELMGHSEYGVTANIYTHVDEATKNNAAMLQDKFIKETLVS